MFGYNEDDEFDRRLEESRRRRGESEYFNGGGGDDTLDELLPMIFGIIIAVGLVLAGLGWLDAQFGWGLRPLVEGWLQDGLSSGG